MKYIFLIFLLMSQLQSNSQSIDMTISGNFTPGYIRVGEPATLNVILSKLNFTVDVPTNLLTIEILWADGYTQTGPPTGTLASLFTWTYIPPPGFTFGGWYGINSNGPISVLSGSLDFGVVGTSINSAPPSTQVKMQVNAPASDPVGGNNFGFAGLKVDAALPIKLLSFNAQSPNCGEIDVQWETASEYNNNYVEVQRSVNAIDFETLTKFAGTNTNTITPYFYNDNKEVFGGINYYYRLKQVDFNGKLEYSKVISAKSTCLSDESYSIYPNPTIGRLFIDNAKLNSKNSYIFQLSDQHGKLIRRITHDKKSNNLLSLEHYPSGVYYIQMDGSQENPRKIIKID